MAKYHFEYLNQKNGLDWEALNRTNSDGSFFHTLRWKRTLERSFNFPSQYFVVYNGGDPVALCPFFIQRMKGLKSLAPPPYSDLKHIIVIEPNDHEIIETLMKASIEIAKEEKCALIIFNAPSLELINSIKAICPIGKRKTTPFPVNGYLSLNLEENNPVHIWNNIFNSKDAQRKYIRRFDQSGFYFRESNSQKDIDNFYRYYSQNLNHIGVTPLNRQHFDIIFEEYQKEVRMTILEKDEELAGGMISFLDPQKKTMHLHYMALNRGMPNTYHPSYALYWEAINRAHDLGYRSVCFGTNTKENQDKNYHIKKGFGCHYIDVYSELMPMNAVFSLLYQTSQSLK